MMAFPISHSHEPAHLNARSVSVEQSQCETKAINVSLFKRICVQFCAFIVMRCDCPQEVKYRNTLKWTVSIGGTYKSFDI